jgi:hypothetical protein
LSEKAAFCPISESRVGLRIARATSMLRAVPVARDPLTQTETLHRALACANAQRLRPRRTAGDFEVELEREASIRRMERQFVEEERACVRGQACAVPKDPENFLAWFVALKESQLGQTDALFPWLAEHAKKQQMCWFLEQERANEVSFGDLVALTQVNMPARPKQELARNYWDETVRGHATDTPRTAAQCPKHALQPEATVWESLALGNLMVALATARHYAYQSLGALGVAELTASRSKQFVHAGLLRLGIALETPDYYLSSTCFDALHSAAWQREVIEPLIAGDSTLAALIAEGALMRLNSAARCFERYRKALWSPARLVANFEYADGPDQQSMPPRETQAEPPPNFGLRGWPPEAMPFNPPNTGIHPRSAPVFRPVRWPEVSRRAH